jgi:hypothetical protein
MSLVPDNIVRKFQMPRKRGNTTVAALHHLWGRQWSPAIEGYLASLRPSYVRVIINENYSDEGKEWQVDVFLARCGDDLKVKSIRQYVQVGLPKGLAHPRALADAVNYGYDSKEAKWWLNASAVYFTTDGIVKSVGDKFYSYPDDNPVTDPLEAL